MGTAVPLKAARTDGSDGRVLALLLLAFGLLGIAFVQSDFFRAVPGDLGDTRFNGLILEHVWRWARGIDASLWSPGFFYPFTGALTFSDSHFGTVGVYMLLRAAGLTPEGAYTGWFTLAYAANYLCCYYALRRFGLTGNASAVGAFLFAFAMPVLTQIGHAQLGYRFAVPLALLAWRRLMLDGRAAQLAWLAVWITVQFYCSIYIGYFLLLMLGGYVVAAGLIPMSGPEQRRPHRVLLDLLRRHAQPDSRRCAVVLLGCAVALLVLFAPYIYFSHLYGLARSPLDIATMLPRPASYLLADGSRLWGRFSQHISAIPMRQEQQIFFGAGALILAGVGVASNPSWGIRVSAWALLLMAVLTIDIGGHSLYLLVAGLPLANSVRAVSRICLVMAFPLAVLVGAGFDRLVHATGQRRRSRMIVAWLLVALMLGECATVNSERVPLALWRGRIDALIAKVPRNLPADAIVFLPRQPGQPSYLTELDGMSLGQHLGRNTINGYSGNQPPGYDGNNDACDDLTDRLTGYVEFTHQGTTAFDALARRVVMLGGASPCPALHVLAQGSHFSGRLPDAMYRQVEMSVAGMAIANTRQLAVKVDVINRSGRPLPSISDSHQPIRFSWRLVPVGTVARPDEEWTTRSNLRQDVPAHAARSTRLLVDAPAQAGRYVLEVSLVQESVAWFHDRGMPIARAAGFVEVARDGSVAIGR